MTKQTRFPAVTKAIRTAREQLAKMPSSAASHAIEADIRSLERDLDGWTVTPPIARQRESMMQRVLAIHLEVMKLVRRRPGE